MRDENLIPDARCLKQQQQQKRREYFLLLSIFVGVHTENKTPFTLFNIVKFIQFHHHQRKYQSPVHYSHGINFRIGKLHQHRVR